MKASSVMPRNHRRASTLLLVVLLLSVCPLWGQDTVSGSSRFTYSILGPGPPDYRIDPGGEAAFDIEFRSTFDAPFQGSVFALRSYTDATLNGFTFISTDPARCETPALGNVFELNGMYLIFYMSARNEVLRCHYIVRRALSSQADFLLLLGGLDGVGFGRRMTFGTLPTFALSIAPVSPPQFGDTEGLVRISVKNNSTFDAVYRDLRPQCIAFSPNTSPGRAPFDIENNFPGACLSVPSPYTCMDSLGGPVNEIAFRVGAIPAGGTTTCLLRLRLQQPLRHSVAIGVSFNGVGVQLANGMGAIDPSPNPNVPLGLALPPPEPVPGGSTLGWWTLAISIFALSAKRIWRGRSGHQGEDLDTHFLPDLQGSENGASVFPTRARVNR